MTIPSEIIARQMHLPRAQTHDVICEEDLRVPMDDGVVLLADRWVARESADRGTADRPGPLAVRTQAVRRPAVRAAAGRAGAAGRDPERARHVRLGRPLQPVRRARRRAGDAALDPRAALALRADRDDRAELPRPRAVGGRARCGRRPRGALDPGQRLAVPRPDLRRRQPVARDLGLVAGARRRAGAAVRAAGDGPGAAAAAGAARRAAARRTSTSARPAPRSTGSARGWRTSRSRRAPTGWRATTPRASSKVTAPVQLIGGWYDIFLPWMLEDFAALHAAGHDAAADHRPVDAHVDPGWWQPGRATGSRGCARTCSATTGSCASAASGCSSPASASAAAGATSRAGRRPAPSAAAAVAGRRPAALERPRARAGGRRATATATTRPTRRRRWAARCCSRASRSSTTASSRRATTC